MRLSDLTKSFNVFFYVAPIARHFFVVGVPARRPDTFLVFCDALTRQLTSAHCKPEVVGHKN